MKPQRRPKEDFERMAETPVEIKPFDSESKRRSRLYGDQLNNLLAPHGATAELFGSTELEVAGKGEWEFAIWLDDTRWYPVLVTLINHYGSIHTLLDDFAVFVDTFEGTPVEIIPLRGSAAERNRAVMDFLRRNPDALQAYEEGKYRHAHSKRAYYQWKDDFIAEIVKWYPD